MNITVIREEFTSDRTIGKLYINNVFFCFVLEDTDRGLTSKMSADYISRVKIAKKTCIPYGEYRVILSYSKKLGRYLPLLLDVRSWRGVRIHAGANPDYSSGCILVGLERKGNDLYKIKKAEKALIEILDKANKTEAIYINIVKHE